MKELRQHATKPLVANPLTGTTLGRSRIWIVWRRLNGERIWLKKWQMWSAHV